MGKVHRLCGGGFDQWRGSGLRYSQSSSERKLGLVGLVPHEAWDLLRNPFVPSPSPLGCNWERKLQFCGIDECKAAGLG